MVAIIFSPTVFRFFSRGITPSKNTILYRL